MIVRTLDKIANGPGDVRGEGRQSRRLLLRSDRVGFSLSETSCRGNRKAHGIQAPLRGQLLHRRRGRGGGSAERHRLSAPAQNAIHARQTRCAYHSRDARRFTRRVRVQSAPGWRRDPSRRWQLGTRGRCGDAARGIGAAFAGRPPTPSQRCRRTANIGSIRRKRRTDRPGIWRRTFESKLSWLVWLTHHVAARSCVVRRRSSVSVGHFLVRLSGPIPGADLPRGRATSGGAVRDASPQARSPHRGAKRP
jgi:hypothetical protein